MTPNKEDYLNIIYKSGGEHSLVSNKQIAEQLGISPASVTEMLLKLKKQGLIHYESYKGSMLTGEGIKSCLTLVRSHRLWEVFLIRHLNYSWSEAHEEAHLLEHVSTDRIIERLDQFLNHPAYCPHGFIIPGAQDIETADRLRPLSMLQKGDQCTIRRVTEERELMDYVQEKGITIPSVVQIISCDSYEGPLTLKTENGQIQISFKAACHIYAEQKNLNGDD